MTEIKNSKRYDLEERTLKFAKEVRDFVGRLKKTINNIEERSKRKRVLVTIN